MPYRLHQRLARGGSSVIDLASGSDGQLVAVKRLALTVAEADREVARARIRREALALRRLHHPHIVPLLDVEETGDDIVLVLPWLAGGDLARRVADHGPLAADDVTRLGTALFDALACAHAGGVVHRDIKPANVLFDADGTPYLADFGVASLRDATAGLTQAGALVGTPEFMAPEQARAETAVAASDVFALAATLRFAATGVRPWGDGDRSSTLERARAGELAPVPHPVDDDLARLLRSLRPMLRTEPARRPPATRGTDRFAALERRTSPTRAGSVRGAPGPIDAPGTSGRRSWRRWRAPALAGAFTAVALTTCLLAWLASTGRPDPAAPVAAPAPAPTAPVTTCPDLPYQPCGQPRAPFTDGRQCVDRHADFDGDRTNGCEAAPDAVDGTELTGAVSANLVPADDVDRYPVVVTDDFQLFCDGLLRITLTSPAGAAMRLEVYQDGRRLGSADSRNGAPASVERRDPNCGEDDATTMQAHVRWLDGARTAAPYRLERAGSY